jgi:hypothetical protein
MQVYHAEIGEAQADPALAALCTGTPFDRLDWLDLMARECLAPARCTIVVAREGKAIAALPLVRRDQGYAALANWYSFIARPRWTDPRLLPAVLRDLARVGAIDFAPLPAPEAAVLRDAARAAGWIAVLRQADRNHVLHRQGRDFATWWAARPGPLRSTVKRKGRALATRIARHFDPADWQAYETVYAQSWKPAEGSPRFLRRLAEAEGAAGRLRLGLALLGDRPVAAQFWTVENGVAYIHKLAHAADAAAHSPGTVLSHALFAMAFDEDRVDTIDFGTGDDGYKADWMEEVRHRYRLEACHPAALRRWPALAGLIARRVLRRDDLAVLPDER